jgi:hypothetical protein
MTSLQGRNCCTAPALAHRLMRLMSVMVDGHSAIRAVDRACASCGSAELYSGDAAALSPVEVRYVRSLLDKERTFASAIASGRVTSAVALGLPKPGELDDIGLSARIWTGSLLNAALVDRNVVLSHLGITAGRHRFIDVPGPLSSVRLDEYAVMHLEENGYERWDHDHVAYMPLVESTLKHPFEIWYGPSLKTRDVRRPNYRFLSLYQLDATYMTHLVIYSPRRNKVVTSHRLTGWPTTMARRSGVPIYAAYVR